MIAKASRSPLAISPTSCSSGGSPSAWFTDAVSARVWALSKNPRAARPGQRGEDMEISHEAFRKRQRRVTLDGLGPIDLELAYTDVGTGEVVVLMHGIPTWSYLY